MALRIAGFALLVAACLLVAFVFYRNSERANIPLIFSPTQVLAATWLRYTQNYIDPTSHRTVDPSRQNVTTSEGESYTMLRAVWMGDKQTFDDSWQFTRDHLQHPNDALFSWLYGKRPDGTYGVLTEQGGATSASDADSDIALALLFAYARWQDPAYRSAAQSIVSDIWDKEVVVVQGTPYLAADNLEKNSSQNALINPSYFSPYAYRLFAKIDPTHPWGELVDSSYALLQKSLGGSGSLPPDWMAINKTTGAAEAATQGLSNNYSFDAMRIPWRLALDWQWNHDPRAKEVLDRMTPLAASWSEQSKLGTVYDQRGSIVGNYESPAMYGSTIGYFLVTDPSTAADIYQQKLVFLFNPDANAWRQQLSYYDDNWAWFGIGLYNHLLPNLAAGLPATAFAYQH